MAMMAAQKTSPTAAAARQQELERRYLQNQQRRNNSSSGSGSGSGRGNSNSSNSLRKHHHAPQLSISDDTHHVTEAIGSYYDEDARSPTMATGAEQPLGVPREARPLSYMNTPSERESFEARRSRRHGTLLDSNSNPSSPRGSPTTSTRTPLARTQSNERVTSPTESNGSAHSPKSIKRMSSLGAENVNTAPTSPPPLSRQSSSDTAIQPFPLNDIDYESSPEAVKQELSNLNALRRMSMNIDTADPDLPSFSPVSPKAEDDEDDPSKLFWVPARLHPELAPKEFKTFIEDRVEKIRRRSGGEDSLSPEGLERSGSGSSLRRKKSMLSHQIDTKGNYEDGAERLERKRSKGMQLEGQTTVANLSDLETLVNDPVQLMRRMSLDTARRSQDSDGIPDEDMPILPPVGTLKRSTRTTYRKGSLKRGERVPFSKRAQQRHAESETEESPVNSPIEPPSISLTRVQTEPTPAPSESRETFSRPATSKRTNKIGSSRSSEDLASESRDSDSPPPAAQQESNGEQDNHDDRPPSYPPGSSQQPRQFHSRIASPGRTTAQLPGYNNTNPLPHIIETLPDGTKVPVANLIQQIPERKSSHELPRQFQRGGAHLRPVPGREKQSSLDDISSHPSPLPGSSNTRTDSLTLVPTFEEKKSEKKEGPRKSSWKWILGNDDEKDKKSKEDSSFESSKSKSGKLSKPSASAEKARLDVLQNSIDGTVPSRGRESLVLNREDLKLDDERKKESKKSSESKKEKEKDSGLLSAIFGGKKKTSDGDLKEKKRKSDRMHSPDPPARILKPDIDYNWTRFSILEERAIYRMAHIKLANPRRALYSQVLLSNFMYSYLAKVQMMHPQIQIPAAQRATQQKGQRQEEPQQQTTQQASQVQQQQQQQHVPAEYNQYQRWQEQQAREQAAQQSDSNRTSFDAVHSGAMQEHQKHHDGSGGAGQHYSYSSHDHQQHHGGSAGGGNGGTTTATSLGGYSVATTHDYLGYSTGHHQHQGGGGDMWDDEERGEDLW